ncbi:hypothetical protein O181_007107 [Austropuccinia psidii MF-1]|uniref:Uncharacterized protein n=1 Tax=Austropuccinia psidii MF-1 TaxID=1389203 RepID=A0A9Q3BLA5_9BASI|nr:hypothetical protein [Austropuccinia psidii MF-1]
MENKRFNLASHWEELGESPWNIFLREISFKDPMEIMKGWNPNKKFKFKLSVERASKIRENQATIQAIEEKWSQKEKIMTLSGSQEVDQLNSPVTLHHSEFSKMVAKSNHYSQLQGVSRRREGAKGMKKTPFIQRKK